MQTEDLGLVSYEEAHRIQLERLEARVRGEIPDTLLLLEHPPVVTLGRGASESNVLPGNPHPVLPCERGGDVTLHLPGQVVGYLIRQLPEGQRDLRRHLRLVEEILLRTLARFELAGRRVDGATGVWVGARKIASIGIACRKWCTWHGFALNVCCDPAAFRFINPCGFEASVMTSLDAELGRSVGIPTIKSLLGEIARDVIPGRVEGPARDA